MENRRRLLTDAAAIARDVAAVPALAQLGVKLAEDGLRQRLFENLIDERLHGLQLGQLYVAHLIEDPIKVVHGELVQQRFELALPRFFLRIVRACTADPAAEVALTLNRVQERACKTPQRRGVGFQAT